ncbi:MAG TPA: acyltransferase [Xanthobacteraceae bacterium]|nr:acyltransferase [Xanthobacteraceae bacterium]
MQSASTTLSPDGGSVDTRAANSYDFVRFCAASAVLFSHHFDLSGLPEPQVPGFREDFGEVAVEVFFCLSGFLICRSLQKSPSWTQFVAARVLRIYPTLAFALIASSAATFIWYRNSPNLAAHAAYVGDNLLLFANGVTQTIPGVFTDATRQDINDPLWTLPYELWCYAALALLFVFGVRRSAAGIVTVTLLVTTAWAAEPWLDDFDLGPLESFEVFRLGSYFMSGAMLAVLWRWIGGHAVALGATGLITALALRNLLPIDTVFHSLALAATVVGLGSSGLMAWFSRGGDASYGMYVFAWPVQQFVLLLIAPFWLSLTVAFLATAALGYATWHAYERRLMAYPKRLAERPRFAA